MAYPPSFTFRGVLKAQLISFDYLISPFILLIKLTQQRITICFIT
ncbi:hypothetical protein MTBBW1_600064 [Desulfamplus magnetovallimortis]|uniref:Uncharacterized protein n=1 Tax=Desulfamplus magnetovallimortis TaxID=1246637 RepID=A0A1W1HID3_9BACT|nr:hypothetical protein MTBBW1_600064 [Desulfamplus magnetovallimortis]